MSNQKKCIIFARVSSRDQEETGYSLPSQEKLLKSYAKKNKFEIAKQFSISESASGRYQRKTFENMISCVKKNNIKIIICEKVDRLTRNLKDAVCINDWISGDTERQVHFVKENCILNKESKSNEKFIWNIKVSVAQYYIENLSEEVKKGQREKISQGWYPGRPPLGYQTIGEKGHKTHIVDKNVAPLIKKMFDRYGERTISINKLADEMYENGLRARSGKKIRMGGIHMLLQNPFYYGMISWNKKLSPGKQEPLITEEMFNKIQNIRTRHQAPKYRTHLSFLFRNIFKCSECGGVITWEEHQKAKTKHIYGHCSYYRNCKKRAWFKEEEINKQIKKLFANLEVKDKQLAEWIKKALKENHGEEIIYRTSAKSELNNQMISVESRLDKLYDEKLDEKIPTEFYDKKFKQYSREQKDITGGLKQLANQGLKYYEMGINIYQLSQNAKQLYEQADLEKKRRLLKLVFDELLMDKKRVIHKYSHSFQVLSQATMQANRSKMLKSKETDFKILEPLILHQDKRKTGGFTPAYPVWLGDRDSNPDCLDQPARGRGTRPGNPEISFYIQKLA